MKPGLANAFLVGFIESMADFGNPIVVGGQFSVLSTEIFFAIVGAQYDQGRAASLALAADAVRAGGVRRAAARAGPRRLHHRHAARATPACRCRCPTACGACVTAIALPWLGFTRGGLPVRLRRRLRADLGPRLHADAAALPAPRSRCEWGSHGLVWAGTAWNSLFTTIKLAAHRGADHRGARPADRLAAGAHAVRRPGRCSSSARCWRSRSRARCSA